MAIIALSALPQVLDGVANACFNFIRENYAAVISSLRAFALRKDTPRVLFRASCACASVCVCAFLCSFLLERIVVLVLVLVHIMDGSSSNLNNGKQLW